MAYEEFIKPIIGAIGSVAGGVLGSKAQQETSQADIAAAERAQEKAAQYYTGGNAFEQTTRTPEGGFQKTQPGAPDAVTARSELARGDADIRAPGVNALDRNFGFTLAGMPQARDVITQANLEGQAQYREGLDKIAMGRQRTGGGVHAPGGPYDLRTGDLIRQYAEANPRGGELAAMELLRKSQLGDLAVKDAHKASLARQVPAPGYTGGAGPGASAAQVLAQMPLPRGVPDYTSSLPFYGISEVVSGVQAQEQRKQDMDRIERMYKSGFIG
jgi:hypothetical protein